MRVERMVLATLSPATSLATRWPAASILITAIITTIPAAVGIRVAVMRAEAMQAVMPDSPPNRPVERSGTIPRAGFIAARARRSTPFREAQTFKVALDEALLVPSIAESPS